MTPKIFQLLRARTRDDGVHLSFYLSRGFSEVPPPEWQGVSIDHVRILRAVDTLGLTMHYDEEYYCGMQPDAAKVIYDGPLEPINKAKFEYVDHDVELRQTYAYWVCTDHGDTPVGPVAVRVRDQETWWPQSRADLYMDALAEEFPGLVSVHSYGVSTLSHPMRGLTIGNPDRTVALTAALHPRECGGPELLLPVARHIAETNPSALATVGVAILPSANFEVRDQFVRGVPWLIRSNPNGVDLNRNFDADWHEVSRAYGYLSDDPDSRTYRGPTPNSESETQAVIRFLESVNPQAVFSYHGIGGVHHLGSGAASADRSYCAACESMTSVYATHFGDGRPPRTDYGTTCGSLPTWVYRHLGVPAFDVEGFDSPIEAAALSDEHTPEMLAKYAECHSHAIIGLLTDLASRT